MSEMIRRTKVEKFVKRLEAKIPVLSKEKSEFAKEVVADMKHEFKLEGETK